MTNSTITEKICKPDIKQIKKRTSFLHIAGMFITALLPVYFFIILEYIHFGSFGEIGRFLTLYKGAGLFSIIVLYAIYGLLCLVVKRSFIAGLIMTILCSLLAVSNYFKHTLTSDFVYPWDIIHNTGNLGELSEFVKSGLPLGYVLIIAIGFLLVAATYFIQSEMHIRTRWRALIGAGIVAIMYISVCTPEQTTRTLGLYNMSINSTSNQEMNHAAHGFTGGFLVNLLSMNVPEPENYSENTINSILAPYSSKPATSGFTSPDIIVILSESFWDPKFLPETSFSKNPTANYDRISKRKNARSGYMYQTSYGGGTVRTEFDVITGMTIDQLPVGSVPWQYVSDNIPSYPSHYKDMGYRTVFMHTYEPSFYMRKRAYPFIGFDELYFQDELTAIKGVDWGISGKYLSDDSFVSYIKYFLEQDTDKPCFLFGISMENHQPYENKYAEPIIKVTGSKLSESSKFALENYSTGIYMADLALEKLINYIDSREKDTLLIYFGDHLPTLGADKAAYKESGFISESEMTDDEWKALLRTPFLVYSNFKTEDSEMLKQGTANEISSYNLINAASDLIGAPKSAFMAFLTDYYRAIPYYNYRLKIKPTDEQQPFITAHKLITYDIMNGKQYSMK
ncbi:MAG: LTA synthase family protein [Clostridia bacterium]|nr:LTA synthase family protein [Clostridia bacterium]